MPSELSKVAVAIVTYGDRDKLLWRVLEGVFAQTAENRIGYLAVCDNGAGRESKALLADIAVYEPRLDIVTLSENEGSAGGYAEALRMAAASGCEYIWCLDDDNLPYPDALELLLAATKLAGAEAALLSLRSALLAYLQRARGLPVEEAFGRPYTFLSFSILDLPKKVRRRFVIRTDEADQQAPIRSLLAWVPWAPYGGLFFRSKLLSRVGLPDPNFYLYCDDREFTTRFIAQGYSVYLVPDSQIEDLEESWKSQPATNRRRWGSEILFGDGRKEALVRQFYEVRNTAFWESHSLGWSKNPLYILNASSYLLLLFIQALLLLGLGQRVPWLSFKVILGAAWNGWKGRLGKVDQTLLKLEPLFERKS